MQPEKMTTPISGEPSAMSPLERVLTELSNEISELQNYAGLLQERLAAVLRPAHPCEECPPTQSADWPLGGAIQAQQNRLAGVRAQIADILERLAL